MLTQINHECMIKIKKSRGIIKDFTYMSLYALNKR